MAVRPQRPRPGVPGVPGLPPANVPNLYPCCPGQVPTRLPVPLPVSSTRQASGDYIRNEKPAKSEKKKESKFESKVFTGLIFLVLILGAIIISTVAYLFVTKKKIGSAGKEVESHVHSKFDLQMEKLEQMVKCGPSVHVHPDDQCEVPRPIFKHSDTRKETLNETLQEPIQVRWPPAFQEEIDKLKRQGVNIEVVKAMEPPKKLFGDIGKDEPLFPIPSDATEEKEDFSVNTAKMSTNVGTTVEEVVQNVSGGVEDTGSSSGVQDGGEKDVSLSSGVGGENVTVSGKGDEEVSKFGEDGGNVTMLSGEDGGNVTMLSGEDGGTVTMFAGEDGGNVTMISGEGGGNLTLTSGSETVTETGL